MRKLYFLLLLNFCLLTIPGIAPVFSGNPPLAKENPEREWRHIYFKTDQGFSSGRLSDGKMSSLHYTGYGGVLNFGRRVHTQNHISELSFARVQFNQLEPVHKNTQVYKPTFGARYMYLKKLDSIGDFQVHAGAQANVFADFRIAPRLSNSYLFADVFAEFRPQAKLATEFFFLRNWNPEFSIAASLLGYGIRMPEYGTTFRLSETGGSTLQGAETFILTPSNFGHFTTGIFFKESLGDELNPNWFRIGYIWDYYSLKGNHGHNLNNAVHQLVLEFFFRMN